MRSFRVLLSLLRFAFAVSALDVLYRGGEGFCVFAVFLGILKADGGWRGECRKLGFFGLDFRGQGNRKS